MVAEQSNIQAKLPGQEEEAAFLIAPTYSQHWESGLQISALTKQKWYWTKQYGKKHSLKQCAHRAEAVLTAMVNSQNWDSIHQNSALILAAAVFTEAVLTKTVYALRETVSLKIVRS